MEAYGPDKAQDVLESRIVYNLKYSKWGYYQEYAKEKVRQAKGEQSMILLIHCSYNWLNDVAF